MAPDEQLRALAPSFDKALASLRDDAPVIQMWRQSPDAIVSAANPQNRMIYEFSDAFWTQELDDLGQSLFELPGLEFPPESPEIVTAQSVTPASVFWFALGPPLSARLPGRRGALLLESSSLARASATVEALLNEAGHSRLLAQASTYYNRNTTNDGSSEATIKIVLESLPRLLKAAHRKSLGVVALSMGEP